MRSCAVRLCGGCRRLRGSGHRSVDWAEDGGQQGTSGRTDEEEEEETTEEENKGDAEEGKGTEGEGGREGTRGGVDSFL